MKVAVVGAHGNIGKFVVEKLAKSSDFEPVAIIRKASEEKAFTDLNYECSVTDIEAVSQRILADIFTGCDAVVFTAGAGGNGGADRVLTVDLDGCMKTIEACEIAGISRFILVSAIKAQDRDFWWNIDGLRSYYIAKNAADKIVMASKLNYTILQPAWLDNGDAKGKFVSAKDNDALFKSGAKVVREDVADFIVKCLEKPKETNRKVITLVNGDLPIDDFIKTL